MYIYYCYLGELVLLCSQTWLNPASFYPLIFSLPTATLLMTSLYCGLLTERKTQRSQRLYYDLIGLCPDHQNQC